MAALVERTNIPAQSTRPGRFRALVVLADSAAREAMVRGLAMLGAVDVAEAASFDEGLIRAQVGRRELTVTEVSLPDGSGLSLLSELRGQGWPHGVVLSNAEDPYTVRAALNARVRGFLVDRPRADRPGNAAQTRRGAGVNGLSGREVEVLEQVADGHSNRDIGESLGLSALTVKSHLARIARKLGTGDRAEMVVLALRAGVID